ncbi:tail fiber domain-containing protein [Chitinophaga varians]|uniref:tail fiber domain-containing protein n=1 Tax=Chitinophaga varians TaxID=2202339 RepID=UPI00165FBDDE|nr:tail fiber domain-containing protein [Chitinophaga varians]MBC9913363.1 tail fiber domain-containing protein [Chitinophaga varians]
MKRLLLFCLLSVGGATATHAQQIYQIRADSVRIYNVCDTAELIIENRTQHTNGFLYNKGNGRTEFRKVRLEKIGDTQIAITGQDTLDLNTLPGITGVDTMYREGDNIVYRKRGKLTSVYAPISYFYSIPKDSVYGPDAFSPWKVLGFGAYDSPDMPLTSEQSTGTGPSTRNYYVGHVVLQGTQGYQMAVNWDAEDLGVRGAFIRGKDDNRQAWSPWRELVFKDYVDNNNKYIKNQRSVGQSGGFWVADYGMVGATNGVGSVALFPGLSSEAGYISFYSPAAKRVGYVGGKPDRMYYNAEVGIHNFAQQIECEQTGRFKGWFNSGSGKAMEVGVDKDVAYAIGYDRTANTYVPAKFIGSEASLEARNPAGLTIFGFRSNNNVNTFGSWIIDGQVNQWSGLNFSYAPKVPSLLFNNANDGGFYQQTTQKWILLWNDYMQTWTTNGNVLWHAGNLNPQATAVANSAALRDAGGNLIANGFFQGSKAILKKNIRPFTENALSLLNKVTIQQFVYKDDKEENVRVGIIADSTDWHFSTKKQDRFDTNSSLAITMKAVQELSEQNKVLQQEVTELKALVKQLLEEKK